MLWATYYLAFFGLLRAREFTVPTGAAFDDTAHMTREDLAVDNPSNPSMLRMKLKASKTDAFRTGVFLLIGRTGLDCSVRVIISYLQARGRK